MDSLPPCRRLLIAETVLAATVSAIAYRTPTGLPFAPTQGTVSYSASANNAERKMQHCQCQVPHLLRVAQPGPLARRRRRARTRRSWTQPARPLCPENGGSRVFARPFPSRYGPGRNTMREKGSRTWALKVARRRRANFTHRASSPRTWPVPRNHGPRPATLRNTPGRYGPGI